MELVKEEEVSKFIGENKGARKFKQTIELAINFRGIDFTKQENKLNLPVKLPHGHGKSSKLAIFADERAILETANRLGLEVIDPATLDSYHNDQAKLAGLLQYELLAQQSLMPAIAKAVGQFLGPRGKMPKPLMSAANLETMAGSMGNSITLRSKGKFLPTVHCIIGIEDFTPEKIYANMKEVIDAVTKKLGPNHIKSAYIKLTMSKPLKVM